jgi:outer membrane protein, heavy metal efflux system
MLREYSGVVRRCVIQFTGLVFILGSPIALANAERKAGVGLKVLL